MNTEHTYTQIDIDNLISENAEESINLEFKAGGALRKETKVEISKDVSAMANSDGGIIIYGIEETDNKATGLKFVDGNEFTKEWLEQIIHNRIQRKIEGLIIEPIRYDGKIEQTIYVVKIPRSLNAPHMTFEKKFYKRYNFMAVEMEEYEIRNLYNRQEKTRLEILSPTIQYRGHFYPDITDPTKEHLYRYFEVNIRFNIKNIGETIEKLYKVEILIPTLLVMAPLDSPNNKKYREKYMIGYSGNYNVYSIYDGIPLFQNEFKPIDPIDLRINKGNFEVASNLPLLMSVSYTNGIEKYNNTIHNILKESSVELSPEQFM